MHGASDHHHAQNPLPQEGAVSCGELPLQAAEDWTDLGWGVFGGPAAREVALWVALQREFRRRNLLSAPAVRRLSAIGFRWAPEVGSPAWGGPFRALPCNRLLLRLTLWACDWGSFRYAYHHPCTTVL